MTIKVVIFNVNQLNRLIKLCRNLQYFFICFELKQSGRTTREVLDFMLANLDLDEDIEVSSDLFIDKENHESVLQEDDMFCLDEESEGVKEIPTVVFVDEYNIPIVTEETQESIFNRLGTEVPGSTAPDKYICTVCNKVY